MLPAQAGGLQVRERWVESKREVYDHSMDPGGVALPFQDQKMSRMQIQPQALAAVFPTFALAGTRLPTILLLRDSLKGRGS